MSQTIAITNHSRSELSFVFLLGNNDATNDVTNGNGSGSSGVSAVSEVRTIGAGNVSTNGKFPNKNIGTRYKCYQKTSNPYNDIFAHFRHVSRFCCYRLSSIISK